MKFVKLLAISLVLVSFLGCAGTQSPSVAPVSHAASFDGNEQNSGIISKIDKGFVVTNHFLDRYDALVEKYGKKFVPALKKREGVEGNIMDKEAMTKFIQMNQWRRSGIE